MMCFGTHANTNARDSNRKLPGPALKLHNRASRLDRTRSAKIPSPVYFTILVKHHYWLNPRRDSLVARDAGTRIRRSPGVGGAHDRQPFEFGEDPQLGARRQGLGQVAAANIAHRPVDQKRRAREVTLPQDGRGMALDMGRYVALAGPPRVKAHPGMRGMPPRCVPPQGPPSKPLLMNNGAPLSGGRRTPTASRWPTKNRRASRSNRACSALSMVLRWRCGRTHELWSRWARLRFIEVRRGSN
jgi:hypothetical protein